MKPNPAGAKPFRTTWIPAFRRIAASIGPRRTIVCARSKPNAMAEMLHPVARFFSKFTVLKGAARELWLTFTMKLLSYAAYAVTNFTLKLWLSHEFGFSDEKALAIVFAWAISMTVVTLLVGALTDAIGLRKAFFLGIWVCIFARLVMVLSTSAWFAIVFGLFPLAVGEALGTPVLVAAVRKFSTTRQRSISFSLSYMLLNVGSFVAVFMFDWVRKSLGEHGVYAVPGLGTSITTYRTLFLASLCINVLMLPVAAAIRRGVEVTDEGVNIVPPPAKVSGATFLGSMVASVRGSAGKASPFLENYLKSRNFTGCSCSCC